jgi:glucosamine kinase
MRLLAVDGGQSTIRLRHSSSERVVEVEGVSRLEGDTVDAVASAVVGAWRTSGFEACDRMVMGLTTAPVDGASMGRLCQHVNAEIGASEIWLADDSVTCHVGALSLGWGVSVTAGTGVACLVVPRIGGPRIIGGHGYLVGDEGGAFWIGREGLRAALRASDGRGPATILVEAASARFGGLEELGARLHSASRPVNDIAHFAPDVLAAADDGDGVAARVADAAAEELIMLVHAAVGVAGARPPDPSMVVPVALGGRLLAEGGPLRRRLDARLAQEDLAAAVRTADGTSLDGALLLGGQADPGRYTSLVHVWREAALPALGRPA